MMTMRSVRASRLGAALAAALSLCGCGGGAPETFDLTAASVPPARPLRTQIAIREPIASLDLDSQRILVRAGPESVAYLSGAQWSDKLPILVQSRLVQTFQNAQLIRSVARAGTGSDADYSLELDIRAFEFDAAAMRATVDIVGKLVERRSGRTVAAKLFRTEAPAAGSGGPAVAAALDGALATIMTQIVAFVSAQL
jgi:cholesterol transport system auxiliary component